MPVKDMNKEGFAISPVGFDRHGPKFLKIDADRYSMGLINADSHFEIRVKNMTTDAERAIEKTEKVTSEFTASIDKFLSVEKRFSEQSKRAAGSVRDSAEKLANGLSKVEKAANFARLEQYVNLLERAATAMNALAELEACGKLDKIAGALK